MLGGRRRAGAHRPTPALEPFVDRIALGEGASAGRVAANPTFAFVTDGPNREVIQVLSSSRKVLRRIKLRSPPHDLGLTERRSSTCGSRSRTASSSTSTCGRASAPTSGSTSKVATSRSPAATSWCSRPTATGACSASTPRPIARSASRTTLGGSPTDLDAVADRVVESSPRSRRSCIASGRSSASRRRSTSRPTACPPSCSLQGTDGWITDSLYDQVVRFDATHRQGAEQGQGGQQAGRDRGRRRRRLGRHPQRDRRAPRRQDREAAGADRHQGPARRATSPSSGGVAWAPGADDLVRIEPRED